MQRFTDRITQIGLYLSLSLLGVGLGIAWLVRQPCQPPKRPRGVPQSARWIGGCERGDWVEVAAAIAGKYQVRIYHAQFGDREREGWYVLSARCLSQDLTPGQLAENISGVHGDSFVISGRFVGKACELSPAPR